MSSMVLQLVGVQGTKKDGTQKLHPLDRLTMLKGESLVLVICVICVSSLVYLPRPAHIRE